MYYISCLDKISCKNITLDVKVNENESFNFTCIPVSSCNNSDDITISSINWKIGYSQDDNFTDLIEGPYAPPGSSPEATKNVVSFTDGTIKNNILQITGMTYYSAGFYKVMNESDEDDNTVLHTFIIYCKWFLDVLYTNKNLVIVANGFKDVNFI